MKHRVILAINCLLNVLIWALM